MMSSLREGPTTVVRREDYAPPAYWIDTVELCFDLDPAKTRVLNRMALRRNAAVPAQPLRLDGEELNLARVLVNGVPIVSGGELTGAEPGTLLRSGRDTDTVRASAWPPVVA